jgi:hypothetical protein
MAAAELNLVIGVIDHASKGLDKITGGLGTVGKLAGGLALGGAVAGVGALSAALVAGIGDAREANLIMAQTEAVIKSTGGAAGFSAEQIADMAGELSAASGKSLFGDDDIQRGQNMLLTFTNISEKLPDATQTMLDMATAMGTDAEAGAIQLGKALNDPINGVSALSRVGVTFTDQQKAQIKTMQEAGDMAGAQAIILAELNKEFGGSAEAAAAADGGMAQFTDQMGELAESVGAKVLPVLNDLLGWLTSPAVQDGISAVVDGLVTGFESIWNAVQFLITGDFSGGIFGMSEDDPWINALFTARETIVSFVESVLPSLQAAFETAWAAVQVAVDTAYQFLAGTVWPWLRDVAFPWLQDTALPALQTAFETAWAVIQQAVDTAYLFFHDVVWPWLEQSFTNLKTTILPSLQAAFDEVWPKIQAAVKAVYDWLSGTFFPWIQNVAIPWLRDVGLPALQTAFETVWPLIETAVRTVYLFFRDTVWPWLQEALRHTTEEEIPAIRRAFETAWPIIQQAVSTAYTWFKDVAWPWLQTALENIVSWMETAEQGWNAAWGLVSGAVETAKNTISTIIATIKNLVQGAIDRINDLIRLINIIPGVEIPTIPTGRGGVTGGIHTQQVGDFVPLGGIGGHPGGGVMTTINIDARGSSDPAGVRLAVERGSSSLLTELRSGGRA